MSPEATAYAERAARITANGRRARERHKDEAVAETALTIAQATALLPRVLQAYGDTARQQGARRRAMQT
jgi:hypothetical protein